MIKVALMFFPARQVSCPDEEMTSSDPKQGHARAPLSAAQILSEDSQSLTAIQSTCSSSRLLQSRHFVKSFKCCSNSIVNGVDYTCLETLRLVNKALAAAAALFLFEVIAVCTAVRKFERITAISEIPQLIQSTNEISMIGSSTSQLISICTLSP